MLRGLIIFALSRILNYLPINFLKKNIINNITYNIIYNATYVIIIVLSSTVWERLYVVYLLKKLYRKILLWSSYQMKLQKLLKSFFKGIGIPITERNLSISLVAWTVCCWDIVTGYISHLTNLLVCCLFLNNIFL